MSTAPGRAAVQRAMSKRYAFDLTPKQARTLLALMQSTAATSEDDYVRTVAQTVVLLLARQGVKP